MIESVETLQINKDVKLLISKMENELKSKDKEINNLKTEVEYLKSLILNKNKKIYGQSSEKLTYTQLSIFNEAEECSDKKIEEPTIEEITYTRKKPSKNKGKKDNLSNLERVTIHHKLEGDEKLCLKCTKEMECIGTSTKEIMKFVPAKLYIEEHIMYSYKCVPCDEDGEKTNIITTKAPATILHKSMASNELLSHVVSLKYIYALPLYREEKYFETIGVNLSRQTLSNWIIGAANELVSVYELMKEELLKKKYIQADETTVTVLEKNGDESRSKNYMWLYKSGTNVNPLILYDYQRTRSGSCPRDFLTGFSGVLQTDGYSGYNKVENVEHLYCMAHIRRHFHDIVITLNDEAKKESLALIGFNYCEKLYEIEKALRKEYSDDEDYFKIRQETRIKKSSSILNEFIEFINKNLPIVLPRSALGNALDYADKLLHSFKIFIEDGSLEIDNNGAERSIKAFVIGRKNWLFSKTKNGATASSILYSIIETAKANNLKAENYLTYLFDSLSNLDSINKSLLIDFMPWSKNLPDNLRISPKE